MLLALLQAVSGALTWASVLSEKIKQGWVLVINPLRVQIELEIDEEVFVFDLREVEKSHIGLFLLVDLRVAVVSHDALIEPTGRQSIGGDQVQHILVRELADSRLRVT